MIPQKATFEVLDKKFVFLVDKEGSVKSQEIEIAGELNHIFFIGKGLKATDRFLLEGLRRVQNGDHIEAEMIPPSIVMEGLHLTAE